jgi:Zn-dependent peptidase ImmA (M78 family)
MQTTEVLNNILSAENAQELALRNRLSEKYPVDIERIIRIKGIKIEYAKILSDGLVKYDNNGPMIKINQNLSSNRKRYTIAHEFGHIILDELLKIYTENYLIILDMTKMQKKVEDFCSTFATSLMIPDEAIKEFRDWENISITNLQEKSDKLRISYTPLMRKVLEQAPYDSGFIWFDKKEENNFNNIQLYVNYAVFPKTKTFIQPKKRVPLEHPIHKYLGEVQERLYENVQFKIKTFYDERSILIKDFGRKLLVIVLPKEISTKNMLKQKDLTLFSF